MRATPLLAMVLLLGCRTVVTTTTEVRPSRYAVREFTQTVPRDSVISYAQQAVAAENLKVRSLDRAAGTLTAGPRAFAATTTSPALEALVTITTQASGPETRVRIMVSSPVQTTETGGPDARLLQLAQHIEQRIGSAGRQ